MGNSSPDPSRDSSTRSSRKSAFEALSVLWQGDREIAIFKPAGLSSERPTHGSSTTDPSDERPPRKRGVGGFSAAEDASARDCVLERARLQFHWPEARLPHRLDRPTLGVLMIAADALRAADHAREIREKKWTKYYIARVEARTSAGAATEIVGRHRAYVRREGRLARCVRSGGDPASLEVLAVALAEDAPRHAHLLIRLETGRFHQIRVMMANLGFPLVGDLDYHGRPWRAGVEAESPTQHRSAARTQASQPSQVAPRDLTGALTGALTGDLKRNLKRDSREDSRGLELLAAGLRIDRAEGPTIIEALPDVAQQLGVAQTMVQKLRGALSVAAR